MSRSDRQSALLVSRKGLLALLGITEILLVTALILIIDAHGAALPAQDLLTLELAAGLVALLLVAVLVVPLRFSILNRRLERTLSRLERGSARAVDNPLGPLGIAFQEHYRLLWRGNRLKEGAIAVHELLLQTVVENHPGRLVIVDGQGRVRLRSPSMASQVTPDSSIPIATEPSAHDIVDRLLAGDSGFKVRLAHRDFHAYGLFGEVFLRPGRDGELQPGEGLAFVILSGEEIQGHRSHPAQGGVTSTQPRRGLLAGLEDWWVQRRRRTS